MIKKQLDLIGAAIGWGAQIHETALGPDAIKSYGLVKKLLKYCHVITWRDIHARTAYTEGLSLIYEEQQKEIAEFSTRLAQLTAQSIHEKHFPIVIGGDHSMAIGTWSGITDALKAQEDFGLIWIDAHMDSHTLETSPSKAIHGMPLAVLLGHGDPSLTDIAVKGPKLSPKNTVLIGVRSYESGEAALIEREHVKVFFMEDVKKRGFDAVFKEALQIVKSQTKGFGVSLDLDAFDPEVAPGVGTPEPEGLSLNPVKKAFKQLAHEKDFVALEIAEYNPNLDKKDKTAKLIQMLLMALCHPEGPDE